MSLSEPFIRRPVGTSLLALGILLLGLGAYRLLPVASLPRVDFPMIAVSASLPGADPETVAASLAAPLERALGKIAGVNEITSSSSLGGCNITMQFDLDRDVDGAARDVQAALNAASSELPIDLPGPPNYFKINPADSPILILTVTSDLLPASRVYELADEIIAQRLSQVEGVSQVYVSGAEKSAVRVQANPAQLAAHGLSLEDVRSLVQSANVDSPKGSIEGAHTAYAVTANDQLSQASQYRSLKLTRPDGQTVSLGELGNVIDSVANTRTAGRSGRRIAGQPVLEHAVLIFVFKQPAANVIATVDRLRQALPQVERWVPPAAKIRITGDRTIMIHASVDDVQWSLVISMAMVVLVIFAFLRRFWPTFIASVSIPMALAGTFPFMYLFHFSLDNLSLMAVTISVGFVIDDAIVVIENIFRHIEHGEPAMTAALHGARQIGFTVVSMSLSLVAVFIPLLFMGGLVGRLFHEFAVTLSVSILVSGVISLTLTPMLCSRFLQPIAATATDGRVFRFFERMFDLLLALYTRGLCWVMRHQGFVLCVTLLTMIGTIWLYTQTPKGFFPAQDTGMIRGTTEAAQDISFAAMDKLQDRCARIVLEDPAVLSLGSFVGGGPGGGTVNNGGLFITLKPRRERQISVDEVIDRLRPKLAQVEGVKLFLQPVQDVRVGGRMSKGFYQYTLQSGNLADLNFWVPRLIDKLREIPQIEDPNTDQQASGLQANVVVDRDAAARLGVSPQAVDETLYDAFGQRQVSIVYERYNQHHVILEVEPRYMEDPETLRKIFVKANSGTMVPLASVARFEATNAYLSVNHQGQFPAATISFNLAPGVSLGQATQLIEQASRDLGMPSSITPSFQGTARVFQSSLTSLPVLIGAAFFAVYIVLGMLYESLIHPLTILSTLPSAGVGALLALIVCGLDLSLVAFIGIVLLMGIVKKNAIMMVDFALDAERSRGLPSHEAIFQACVVRFRPIMMTSLAAFCGAIPLAVGIGAGSELRQPLGVAVIGGLLVSQLLTLYTTPVVYLFFERCRAWLKRSRLRFHAGLMSRPAFH